METQVITVGGREFQFLPLLPFAAVAHLTRLKNIATTGINGALTDVSKILDGIDDKTLEKVIFPILRDCNVVCTTESKRLTTPVEMNALFTIDNLDEFFEVVVKVLRYNFEPLVKKTLARFGIDLDQLSAKATEKAKARIENHQSSGETTSSQKLSSGE